MSVFLFKHKKKSILTINTHTHTQTNSNLTKSPNSLHRMESFSGNFTFTNKENTHHLQKVPPKTPHSSKSVIFKTYNENNNNNAKKINVLNDGFKSSANPKTVSKRVPLGGKDHNAFNLNSNSLKSSAGSLLTASASKRRAQRLKTPLTNKNSLDLGKKKLNVLKDEDDEQVILHKEYSIEADDYDDEIEYVPEKDPELPYVPLNYKPFTEKELEFFRTARPNPRLEDLSYKPDVNDPYEEFSISFSDVELEEDEDQKENQGPHFMEPTFVSNAKKVSAKTIDAYGGLSAADFQRLIDDE